MPRAPRQKYPEAIYHVMCHSINEINLFPKPEDKEYFLDLLKKYKEKFNCKIYGYCLMSNHYHLHIDMCGADISKFMKSLNLSQTFYINKKYTRKGPLFWDRFKSKIIDTDEYNLTVSSYIHRNAKDVPGFNDKIETYLYSSMGIYLGKFKDTRDLVNTDFILGCINKNDKGKAINQYAEMVIEKGNKKTNIELQKYLEKFDKEYHKYDPGKVLFLRNKNPQEVIKLIADRFGNKEEEVMLKWKTGTLKFRRVVAYALNVLCDLGYKQMCSIINNISSAGCADLSRQGFEIVMDDPKLKQFIWGLR